MRRLLHAYLLRALALVTAVAALSGGSARASQVSYAAMADSEAGWLWTQQLSNGAFAYFYDGDGEVCINPYFSSECAIALIRHDVSRQSGEKIKAYLNWFFRHLNSAGEDRNGLAGTIYDYTAYVKDGLVIRETTRRAYDSTDSYAALFLIALYEYSNQYGDSDYIASRKQSILQVIDAMLATRKNGYTFAKPDYEEYYLMDNCEVYAGMTCAAKLCEQILKDPKTAALLKRDAAFCEAHFASDWRIGDHYADALYTSVFSWNTFYQCAVSQAFPVLFGLVRADSEEARALYRHFCRVYAWENLEHMTSGQSEYYWGHLALWGARMGDTERVDTYLQHYRDAVGSSRAYPLVSADAALVLITCDEMQRK